ncbi:hypothetical protein RDI58_024882 [Solanum bulbocastanum]|uniref:Uncharacterized protein n=1 Tax=Solanum bulbocastanum TaxID=147425 RepID=A0AAN8Y3R4_SOLBU
MFESWRYFGLFVCHFVTDPVLVPSSLEYGESGVGEGASQNSGSNASFDAELEPTHGAQENASNPIPAPANSNISSPVYSFTAPNIPPPTHQTPTPIHPSTDPTLDPVHPTSDLISNAIHPSNEHDSDRESLNVGFNGSDVSRPPSGPSSSPRATLAAASTSTQTASPRETPDVAPTST